MSYDDFLNHRNKLGNLWTLVNKGHEKKVIECLTYNEVLNIIQDKGYDFRYYIY